MSMQKVKVWSQGHRGQTNFAPIWACPDHNSSLNSHMATKWCTKVEVVTYEISWSHKANLRDLIGGTSLVIFLKLDSNPRFFGLCELEIWWMTLKNNGAPLLYYTNLYASEKAISVQNWAKVQKRPNLGQNQWFFSHVTFKKLIDD